MTAADGSWQAPEPGWTCPECGWEYDSCAAGDAADAVRGFARRYRAPLTRGLPGEDLDALLRTRPATGGWSALEYACHARDVFLVTNYRIPKILAEDRPTFRRVDPDAGATERDYNSQDPAVVGDEIAAATESLAATLASVPADGWTRVGIRDGEELSVTFLACNAIHEGAHHLLDLARVVRTARGR
jgi:hypothetical protein